MGEHSASMSNGKKTWAEVVKEEECFTRVINNPSFDPARA